jgi:hypothetical protein
MYQFQAEQHDSYTDYELQFNYFLTTQICIHYKGITAKIKSLIFEKYLHFELPNYNKCLRRMASSGMLNHVALVRTDVSEELSASFIRVTRIGELGTRNKVFLHSMHKLLVTANIPSSPILVTLMKEALSSSRTSVLTRATWYNIPEDGIVHSHSHENLKSYI